MRRAAWRAGMGWALTAVAVTLTTVSGAATPATTTKVPPRIPPPQTPAAQQIDPAFNTATGRAWIAAMKQAPRGPFDRIRYFCADGQVLEPKAYICEPFGGGYQHGEWNAQTKALRAAGFPVANLLAG